ncbi:nucleoside 2-deoxyribosyltransferase [Bradyrhizobium daqingense]|uniref:Uncharacterized protein n=1 Tax=Bradyrhizobium daqingense TaxID=993502 RepID=A0A562KCD6_9BRAD|nr:hypothetical protein [Bradyrhizobium daqingense]TWH92984.1 hypothetical protein IQ17_07073 [Bradyrhizobium daqingense]UFS89541.1 nucleoside 2-deoxyribosyltransferase [Bradyrhizobium daqingense]
MSLEQIRVLVAGHTGLNKLKCIEEHVVPFLLERDADWRAATAKGDQEACSRIRNEQILVLELERAIPSTAYGIIGTPSGRASWMSSFLEMKRTWLSNASKPKYVFLLAHLSFQSESHFYTPITWTHTADDGKISFAFLEFLLDDFKPTFIITLIDDVYSVQARLNPRRHFRLSELLRWRNVEALFADYVMDAIEIRRGDRKSGLFPRLRSPIFSVRQSIYSLITYISDPNVPRIYLSYPITKPLTRWRCCRDRDMIDQINHFRHFFSAKVSSFDPLTINERPIQIALDGVRESEHAKEEQRISTLQRLTAELATALDQTDYTNAKTLLGSINNTLINSCVSDEDLDIRLGEMWPTEDEDTIAPFTPTTQISIKRSEMDEVITKNRAQSVVDRQIRVRDLRLIDQSDCVVIYRPGLSKKDWSTGTQMECSHARASGKAIIILKEIDDAEPMGPFDHKLPAEDVIVIEHPANEDSRKVAFGEALARVKHYSEEFLRRNLR